MSARGPACNRCRTLKEKCSLTEENSHARLHSGLSACTRCQRLGKPCITTSVERWGKGGRPRKPETASTSPQAGAEFVWFNSQPVKDSLVSPTLVRPSDRLLSKLKPQEMPLLEHMFCKRTFIHSFILDSTFADAMLSHLFKRLNVAPDLLLNAYLACLGQFWKSRDPTSAEHRPEIDYANSARAVQALRTVGAAPHIQEAELATALTLGLGIITFDLLASGKHAHGICRSTLGVAELFGHSHSQVGDLVSDLLIPLQYLDAANCIIRRQTPIPTPWKRDHRTIDRYVGLCCPLLPHLFELCTISCALANVERWKSGELHSRLDEVERQVIAWKPHVSCGFAPPLSTAGSEAIHAQARMHRCALMLIIHQLRYPCGTQDTSAKILSRRILDDVKNFYRRLKLQKSQDGKDAGVQFEYRLNLPLLVASVDLTTTQERQEVYETVPLVVCDKLYPNLSAMFRQFLVYIWRKRDAGGGVGHWFDWVPEGPPVVVF